MRNKQVSQFKESEIGAIPENWDISKISEVAKINESSIKSSYPHKTIEYVDISSVDKGRLISTQILDINDSPSRAKRIVKDNDILLSTVRPNLQHFYFIKHAKNNLIASTGFAVISPKSIHPRFLYYFLTTKRNTDFFSAIADTQTSTYPAFNAEIIDNLYCPFPDINEQDKISKILSDLDDKIEINQEMNQLLEAIGQAIFKHWFVDFEFPDENGKPYQSSGGKMVDSELGVIPEGWKVGKLGDISDITMGQSPPGETYNETGEGVPFYQGIRDFGFRFPSRHVYCSAPTRFAQESDILLSVRAPIGRVNIAEQRVAIGRGVASIRLKGKNQGFLYYLLLSIQSGWDVFEAEGTVFGAVTKHDINDFIIVVPPEIMRDKFSEIIKCFDMRILVNEKESRALSLIRDSLLPRLMSGKIRVPVSNEAREFA